MKFAIRLSVFAIIFLMMFEFDIQAATTYKRGIIKSYSSVRKTPGGEIMKSDTGGNINIYSPEAVEIVGESGTYYQIKFMYVGFVYVGYVPKNNVIAQTYTTDDAYEADLINRGFPADYAKKLAILHAIHPNWTFAPSYTGRVTGGMDFYTAVNGEYAVVARNVIDSSNTSLRSTADVAYKNGVWIPLAGNGWYGASAQTVAFYMDPRNFLDESHIFMFENGAYNGATQTKDQISKILSGTFMSKPFDCLPGANNCSVGTHYYVDTFLSAGADKNVNPNHLASRVVQEQGTKGSTLSLGQGYNGNYKGYYNFFNIGASGKVDSEVIINGLIYAMNRNWNNQHISIYEGSSFLSNNYISRGQSTKYYQKFNTITPSYYGNQYMQNVRAPYQESYKNYEGYYNSYSSKEAWDLGTYDFLIPIYSNMGAKTSLDSAFNADSTLKSLNVAECKLNPEFQSSAYNYDCYVKEDVSEVNISAEATNGSANLTNPGKVKLTQPDTTAVVKVTAVNGESSDYVISIHRIKMDGYTPTEVLNGVGIKVSGNYASNIEVGSDISNIINSVLNSYHFASIKVTDNGGAEIKSGIVKTGQTITITNSGITSSFKIVLYGDINGDGLINIVDLLAIQKHLVGAKMLKDENLKAADLNKDGALDIRDLLLEQKNLLGEYTISQG